MASDDALAILAQAPDDFYGGENNLLSKVAPVWLTSLIEWRRGETSQR